MPKAKLQTRFRFETSRLVPYKDCMVSTSAAISNGEPELGIRFAFDDWNEEKPCSISARMDIEAAELLIANLNRQIVWCKEQLAQKAASR